MNVLQVVQAPKRIRYESGSNANGTWQITYENDVVVRVLQYKSFGLLSAASNTKSWPIAFPNNAYMPFGNSFDAGRIISFTAFTASNISVNTSSAGIYAYWAAEWIKV